MGHGCLAHQVCHLLPAASTLIMAAKLAQQHSWAVARRQRQQPEVLMILHAAIGCQHILLSVTASNGPAYCPTGLQVVRQATLEDDLWVVTARALQGCCLELLQLICSFVACVHLQTANSGYTVDAAKTTRKEFEDNMCAMSFMARGVMMQHGMSPLFSWDNNIIQATASLQAMAILAEEQLPLGAYMPDAHKVIEHFFARLKAAVQLRCYQLGSTVKMSPQLAQQIVQECFYQMPQQSIAADVKGLPLTYAVIAQNGPFVWEDGTQHTGVAGAWAPKKYR
jgi:hypothetical protein